MAGGNEVVIGLNRGSTAAVRLESVPVVGEMYIGITSGGAGKGERVVGGRDPDPPIEAGRREYIGEIAERVVRKTTPNNEDGALDVFGVEWDNETLTVNPYLFEVLGLPFPTPAVLLRLPPSPVRVRASAPFRSARRL